MKAIQVVARGQAEIVDIPKPEIKPEHVLVRSSLLSLCGSDVQMLHFAADESYPFSPGTTGHEMVGVVEAIEAEGSDISVGDKVLALAPGHRAMSEYYLAPVEHVLPLPEGKPLEELLQAQQLGTVLYASQRLPNVIGKNVVVIGQGSAGLWFNFLLKRMGALNIIALDLEPFRLELSKQYGATHTICNADLDPKEAICEITGGDLADIVIEAAGEVESINLATDLVRKYGDILYFGYPRKQTFLYDYDRLFQKCCRATTIVGAANEENQISTRIALDMIANGEADAATLITHRIPFSEVLDAYELHRTRRDGTIKIVVEMPE